MIRTNRFFTVLVVDDEALLRWSIATLLRENGHTVIEAASADHARAAVGGASDSIDAVLLDYHLPDSSDLRLLAELRVRLERSPVLLMTAFSTPELVERAMSHGAFCVLSKPFDMFAIEGLITAAVQGRRSD